eukprot:Skav214710  [mRNA]  locus=scaffold2250:29170:30675:+ [translate_table: standard]
MRLRGVVRPTSLRVPGSPGRCYLSILSRMDTVSPKSPSPGAADDEDDDCQLGIRSMKTTSTAGGYSLHEDMGDQLGLRSMRSNRSTQEPSEPSKPKLRPVGSKGLGGRLESKAERLQNFLQRHGFGNMGSSRMSVNFSFGRIRMEQRSPMDVAQELGRQSIVEMLKENPEGRTLPAEQRKRGCRCEGQGDCKPNCPHFDEPLRTAWV